MASNRHGKRAASVVVALAMTFLAARCEAFEPAIELRVAEDGWGQESPETARLVLESAASELLRHFPGRRLPPIAVEPRGGPMVLHERGPDGEIRIRLETGDRHWSQYVYQFSHEMCHVLCRYDRDETGVKWFEESLCEMASLYVLRRLGVTWAESPPFDRAKAFAPHMTSYADRLIAEGALSDDVNLATWYAENADHLSKSPTDRERNRVAAVALLPFFESTPEHWAAVEGLNGGRPRRPQTLAEHLRDWRDHVPPPHRAFTERIAEKFGVVLTPYRPDAGSLVE